MATAPINLTSLTEEQQLALQQFTSVTDQELSAAVPLLKTCQWNAQIAITRFFDGDTDTVDPAAEAARPLPPIQTTRRPETLLDSIPSRSVSRNDARRSLTPAPRVVPIPDGQMTQQLPFPFSILLLPFNLTYAIFQRVLGTVGYLFPFIPRLLSRFYSGRTSQPSRDSGRRPLNPRDTAARFIREFEEEYGVTHGTLPFYEGGYAQAFDVAKRDLMFMVVVLMSPEHDNTARWVRETLLSPEFVEFVKNSGNSILLWAGTVQDAEAYQVASALNVTRFPYACMIVHTPSVSSTAMSKIATAVGRQTSEEIINSFQTAMNTRFEELDRVRAQRQEQQASRNLRVEQESAYERSLAQDREKARRRKEEEARQEMAEKMERARVEKGAEQARKQVQWRRWKASTISAEPEAEIKDAVRISIRLPSGERVVRKFRPEADLEELYAFVECYDLLESNVELSEKGADKPKDFQHEYMFRLVSPMPREVYDLHAGHGGALMHRIGRSANLLVEQVLDEEEENEDSEGG